MGEEASAHARLVRVGMSSSSPRLVEVLLYEREVAVNERDEGFMARAIELARRAPRTHPNPRVGCVVVRDGAVIGEGWHRGAGHPHAEPIALAGLDARDATVYVTLEPCVHHGRTPPCAKAIIDAGVQRAVVAIADPDERVGGRGLAALAAAGLEVEVGVLADEAEALNAPYLHHRRTGTSFVSLKLALSLDGGLAAADRSARWITGELARGHVHQRRHEVDAVMVGAGTVVTDDPELTVRDFPATRQPIRIVVDASGRVPSTARIFSAEGNVIIATTDRGAEAEGAGWAQAGAEVVVLPATDRGVDLHGLLKELGARDFVEIMCEGGAELATSLLREGLVDRLELHYGPLLLGAGAVRLGDLGIRTMADVGRWSTSEVRATDEGFIATLVRSEEND
jgi:diaminohydroxyphosphoribosylaminopyrimidine deaminase/5-amino-6-(5-phosphoribosylamino)uracil reductase